MTLLTVLAYLEKINTYMGTPSTILFLGVAIYFTFKTSFVQLRAFPRFVSLLRGGVQHQDKSAGMRTINPMHALFTAMATTIGMGNVVGPTLAIVYGGPGALFWLLAYAFFGAVTRFVEVVLAVHTREKTESGSILGGPMQYLKLVHPWLAYWYGGIMMIVFAGWSGNQANTLAGILAKESISPVATGLALVMFVFVVLMGGARRVGAVASKLVPFMFILYVSFALLILFRDVPALGRAIMLVLSNAFTPEAAIGSTMGIALLNAMRWGTYQSIYITEAGLGTSAIAHAIADVKKPTDQGILALYSIAADAFLCMISGLLVLVTGIWTMGAAESNTFVYEVFKSASPDLGRFVLIVSIGLFVITTVIGNSFNGSRTFASFTNHRWLYVYDVFVVATIFCGALMDVRLIWSLMHTLLTLVAIPNLIGLVILSRRYSQVLKV